MKRVRVGDLELAVHDQGAGRTLLLVHGFPLDHSMWQGQIDGFAGVLRVIAPDLRGFGASDMSDEASMAQLADDLAGLLDALDVQGPVCFCGLSMGGYVAWEFFRRHHARVGSLVLCDTRAAPDSPEAAQGREKAAEQALSEGVEPIAQGMISKLLAAETFARQSQTVSNVERMMRAAPPRGVAAALRGMAHRMDARPLLSTIDVPTLSIVGTEDVIATPEEMRAFTAKIPAARLVEIPHAGHMAPLEQPQAVNHALRAWLGI